MGARLFNPGFPLARRDIMKKIIVTRLTNQNDDQ
jgi:hypothetical protein